MFKYINIGTMSMFLMSLYIVYGNWSGNKSKRNSLLLFTLITIIICKMFFITYDNKISMINLSYTYEIFIVLFVITLKVKDIKNNRMELFIFINYLVGVLSLVIYSLNIAYLYKQLISMYMLMATLYLFYMSNTYKLSKKYQMISILYFAHISISLLLYNNVSLTKVGYTIDMILSVFLFNDVFKIKMKNIIRKNISTIEKLENHNIRICSNEDKISVNKNITETLNGRLNKKENVLETILGQCNKCVIVVDNNGYIVNEDESFVKMWKEYRNYKYELALSTFLANNIKKPEKFLHYINEANELGMSIEREFEGNDGRIFNCTYSPCKINYNHIGTICHIVDITYRRRSEIKIKENDTKYKTIVDNIPYPIILTDENNVIYENEKYEKVNLDKYEIEKIALEYLDEGEVSCNNYEKDEVYLNIDRVSFNDEESTKNLVVIRDITHYKQLLTKVKSSKEKYESLVNLIPEGIYILDFETKVPTYANSIFLEMANATSLEEVRLEEISEGMVINSINSNESIKFCRKTIKDRNKQEIHIECGGMVIDVNKKLKVVGIIRDVTEQVKAEQIEIEIEKKKIEYKNKNEFFVNMSHELKTPLNLILSSNQLLEALCRQEIQKNPQNEISNVVSCVNKNSYFIMGLINNIMDLSKLEQNFYQYKKDYYNMVDIVEEISINFSKCIEENEIEIVFDTDEEEKVVNIDPDDIEKVVLTLLSSIIRYSNARSLISVELKTKNGKDVIEIKNEGGYDSTRYSNDLQRRSLDIAIEVAKQIIELYNGHINIETMYDRSIRITVEIRTEKNKEEYNERIKIINQDIIYSDYIRMCNF